MNIPSRASILMLAVGMIAFSHRAEAQERWATNDDYPAEALRERAEGVARVEVLVGHLGEPLSCHIIKTSGNYYLDEASCNMMMRRGKWSAAKDELGNPKSFTYQINVRWKMPLPQVMPETPRQ